MFTFKNPDNLNRDGKNSRIDAFVVHHGEAKILKEAVRMMSKLGK
jgi:hypothetical protein